MTANDRLSSALSDLRRPSPVFTMLRFSACPNCEKALSIGEVIERHCENCEIGIEPVDLKSNGERAA